MWSLRNKCISKETGLVGRCWFIEDHSGGPLCVLRNHVFKPVFTQIWTSEGWLDWILSAGNLTNFSILVRSTHRRKTHSLPPPYAFNFLHLSSHVAHLVSRLWDKGWTKTGMPTAAWSEKKTLMPCWTYYDFKAAISLGNTSWFMYI